MEEKRYTVVKGDTSGAEITADALTLTGAKGTYKWDVGSEITSLQAGGEEEITKLVEAGKIVPVA